MFNIAMFLKNLVFLWIQIGLRLFTNLYLKIYIYIFSDFNDFLWQVCYQIYVVFYFLLWHYNKIWDTYILF